MKTLEKILADPGAEGSIVPKVLRFTLAQLAIEATFASTATPGRWRYSQGKCWKDPAGRIAPQEAVFTGPDGEDAATVCLTGDADDLPSMRDARHIAYWDPARVGDMILFRETVIRQELFLAERRDRMECGHAEDQIMLGWCPKYQRYIDLPLIFTMALSWWDQPGFDDDWWQIRD